MKVLLLKALHLFKLDVLLLRVLEKLSASLTKKHAAFKAALSCRVSCRISATEKFPIIA